MGFVDVQSGGGAGAASMSPSVAGGNHPMSNKSWLMSRLTVPPRFAKRLSPLSLSILSKINHQSHVKHNVFSCDWCWQDWVTEVGFFVTPLKRVSTLPVMSGERRTWSVSVLGPCNQSNWLMALHCRKHTSDDNIGKWYYGKARSNTSIHYIRNRVTMYRLLQ